MDAAIEKAAEALWRRIMNPDWTSADADQRTIFLKDASATVAAFLRTWEPSDEAVWASQLAPDTTQNRRQIKLGMKAAAVSDAGTIERAMTATTGTTAGKEEVG